MVINATAIIPQTDKALRILLAVGFRVLNSFLDIDFRLGWGVNGAHLTFCAVAHSENGCWFGASRKYAGVQGLPNLAALRNQVVALPCASFQSRSLPSFGGGFQHRPLFRIAKSETGVFATIFPSARTRRMVTVSQVTKVHVPAPDSRCGEPHWEVGAPSPDTGAEA